MLLNMCRGMTREKNKSFLNGYTMQIEVVLFKIAVITKNHGARLGRGAKIPKVLAKFRKSSLYFI